MRGLAYLAWRHLAYNRWQSTILIACLAVPIFLPWTTSVLLDRYRGALTERAAATPLLAGTAGSRFDLTLAALWFREAELTPLSMDDVASIQESGLGTPVPLRLGHTAQGAPIVGTTPEYFAWHALTMQSGTPPAQLGDVAVGHRLAERLGLAPGDPLFSDQPELYDLSVPPALKMTVSGVLAATDGPEDDAAFTAIETTWVIAGIIHGHDAADGLDERHVQGRVGNTIQIGGTLVEYQEITDATIDSFHAHAEPAALPVSGIVILPPDTKSGTLLKARWNADESRQIVVPSQVVDELLAFVLRVKTLVDGLSILLGVSTLALATLLMLLSLRLRAGEIETLHKIGCRRRAVAWLCGLELLGITGAAVALAALLHGLLTAFLPDLIRFL